MASKCTTLKKWKIQRNYPKRPPCPSSDNIRPITNPLSSLGGQELSQAWNLRPIRMNGFSSDQWATENCCPGGWFGARRLSAKQVGQDIRLQVALNMYLFLAANVTRTTEVRWWEQGTFFLIDSCHVKVFPTHAFNTAWLQTTTYWIAQQGRRWTQLSSSICKSGGPERIRQSWWSAARGESTLCIASLGPIVSLRDDSGMNDALGSSASYNIYLLGLWFLP